MSRCTSHARLLEAFVDGELSTERILEVENHIADCPVCLERVRLNHALKVSVREVVRGSTEVTESFERRVAAALAAERQRTELSALPKVTLLPWRAVLPMVAAAAVVLVWAASNQENREVSSYDQPLAMRAQTTDGVEALIDDFVRYHADDRPADVEEIPEPATMTGFQPELGLPVHVPRLDRYGASWEFGALVPVRSHHQRAALMRYRLGNRRVTVYVYDASKYPLRARLEPRVVGNVPVFVGERFGYSIAAAERHGVGYAAAADLDDTETAELVAAAFP